MPNTEALRQLRRVVENAPDDLFHMRAVVEHTPCGTARCAIGWARVDPWFLANTNIEAVAAAVPEFGDASYWIDWKEVANLFGTTFVDALVLFGANLHPDHDPHAVSKADVVANIDRLIADEPAEVYEAVWMT